MSLVEGTSTQPRGASRRHRQHLAHLEAGDGEQTLDTVRDVYGYDYRTRGRRLHRAARDLAKPRVRDRLPESDPRRRVAHAGELGASEPDRELRSHLGRNPERRGRRRDRRRRRRGSQTTGSVIDTETESDFWADLAGTLQAILGTAEGRQIVVNAQSGVVFARGMPDELRAVAEYLGRIHSAAQRQVVLEAKIIEVTLADGFQAGVNWAAVQVQADGDTISGGNLSGGGQIASRAAARRRSDRDRTGQPDARVPEPDDRRGVRARARHRRLQRIRRASRDAGRHARAVEPARRDAQQSEGRDQGRHGRVLRDRR